MKRILFLPLLAFGLFFFSDQPVGALALKAAPLEYRVTLKKGEKQKGFIDVSNPTGQTVIVRSSVEAFTQTDDKGSLRFFKNEQLSAGIQLDLDEFELGPREAVRMYFQADGTKLPPGDAYGAIFFTTTTDTQDSAGTAQNVRVGTLLSIVNGTPGQRKAEVTSLKVPLLNFGNTLQGTYRIKNTADPKNSTGFYPNVTVKVSPFGDKKVKNGPLVFAGRTRENNFNVKAPLLGIYRVSAAYGSSSKSTFILVANPIAILAIIGLIIALKFAHIFLKKRNRILINRQR